MRVKSLLAFAATSAIAFAACGAHATTVGYTSSSAFIAAATGPNAPAGQVADQVDWSQFDSMYHQNSNGGTIGYGSSMTTAAHEGVTITNNTNPSNLAFTTFTEGGVNPTWQGSFTAGTTILYNGNNETTTLSFTHALSGLGVDLQTERSGNYTFTLTAYDANNNVLGTSVSSGVSHGINNGSTYEGTVAFDGITSTSANISYVTISSTNDSLGFAIDTSLIYHNAIPAPLLRTSAISQQTPEPGTLGLLGAGLAGLGAVRRKLGRKKS